MKTKALQLSIVNPCAENWDNMTAQEQGRHCDSCNKTVIDFTLFTDKQLIEFFKKATDGICGRATKYQLQRQMVYTEQSKHPLLSKFVFGTTLLAGLSTAASAQQTGSPVQQTTQTERELKNDDVNAYMDIFNSAIALETPNIIDVTGEEKPTLSCLNDVLSGEFMGMIGYTMSIEPDIINTPPASTYTDYVRDRNVEQAIKPGMAINVKR